MTRGREEEEEEEEASGTVSAHNGTREERNCARRWRDVGASESLVGRRSLARESAPKWERDGERRYSLGDRAWQREATESERKPAESQWRIKGDGI